VEHSHQVERRRLALGKLGLAGGLLAAIALVGAPPEPRAAPDPTRSLSATGRTIVAEVRNGTNRPGLARQVTKLLRQRGVDVIYFGTAPAADSTAILVRRGDPANGREVARLLGVGPVKVVPDTLLRVDLTVLLGADYRLPKDQGPL
jgi:hypothetical protein